MQSIKNKQPKSSLLAGTYAHAVGYAGVVENIYTANNQAIIEWTRFFQNEVTKNRIFNTYNKTKGSNLKAVAVSTQWYNFSEYVPKWLCLAASKVSTNEKRHYVIQTAFEELGMRTVDDIHCMMFKDAAISVGIKENVFAELKEYTPIINDLITLDQGMQNARNDDVIMGMLLGLEAPAVENIEAVFNGLGYSLKLKKKLQSSEFFKIHRAVEEEHVRLTVSNFLRFCKTKKSKNDFIAGFNFCLDFWKDFWNHVTELSSKLEREQS